MNEQNLRPATDASKYQIPEWKKKDPFAGRGDGGADVFYDGVINTRTIIPPSNPAARMTDEEYAERFPNSFVPSWAREHGGIAAVPTVRRNKL